MAKTRTGARKALRAYVEHNGTAYENSEPREWQASDLITDLLLTFPPIVAERIMARVERDNREDRQS